MKPVFGILSLLIVACWAAPQLDEQKNVAELVDKVFGDKNKNPNPNRQQNPTTENLDDLISSVFTQGPGAVQPNQQNNFNTDGEGCQCVPYYQCQNGTILEDGVGLIDIRLKPESCEDYLDVCCNVPSVLPPSEKMTPRPIVRSGCGHRNPEGVGFRITGARDNEAQFGEFPWMVAILKEETVGNQAGLNVYHCGGALIHPRVVLTAAHCVNQKDPRILKVRAGEWDTQTKNEIYPHQDRPVEQSVVHPRFHAGALHYDFALLLLAQPVEIAENVDIACLPHANDVFDYDRCFASGWGKDVFGKEGHYQVILKRVELPVVPYDTCQNTLRTTRLGKYFRLDSSFICAGGEPGKDTCKGDGGSPLVCPIRGNPSRYAQAGIVSWGIGCGENQIPGVYANVAAARTWIDQQMLYWNLDPNLYEYNRN